MTRKALLIAILTVVMGSHMTACSSSGSKDDTSVAESNDETFAEEGEGDFADTASTDKSAPADAAPADQAATDATQPEDAGADLSLDDQQATAQNGDAPPADAPIDAPPADVAATDKPADDLSLDDPGALPEDTTASTTPPADNITENPATPSDAGVFDAQKPSDTVVDAAPTETAPTTEPAPEPAPVETTPSEPTHVAKAAVSYAPLMKVKDAPFTGPGGATLNRVYIARPKDTSKSVAQKIYGDSKRSKDLVKWNPILKRGVRTGDKIYYASAANPSDSKMMNFHEEAGVAPQTYVTKDGDNLRTVSKELLGFKDAWKEVWETNPSVEPKGRVPAGLTLNYWPETGASAPVQTMAQTSPPPTDAGGMPTTLPDAAPQVPPQAQVPSDAAAAAGTTAPPPADPFSAPPSATTPPGQPVADSGAGPDPLAPPPPSDAMAQAVPPPPANGAPPAQPPATDPLAAAPPVQQQAANNPPPAKPKKPKMAEAAPAEEAGMDPDTTMALGVGGVLLLAAAILFVVIRKNRAKRMDLGQTQV